MKKEIKDFYIISVLGMLLIALFYILIIPDLEAYSDSKTVYMCNNRIGNYNCFEKQNKNKPIREDRELLEEILITLKENEGKE